MIIDEKITIKIAKYNINHYKQYFDVELKDIIDIDTALHLQKNSNIKINVQCDLCPEQRYIKYQAYTKNINSCIEYPIYTCDKCSHIKLKQYNKKKYGVEYFSQTPDYLEKFKKTMLDRYGVEHALQSNIFQNKVKKTNLEKFGYINPYMDKERIKNIFKDKYGVNHPSQLSIFCDKAKKVNFERYGYENVLLSPEIRKKIEDTNIERYGYKYPQQSNIVKNKMFETNLNKYGFKSFFETELFKAMRNEVGNIQQSDEFRKDRFAISRHVNYIKYLNSGISLFNCDKGHNFEINIDNYSGRIKQNIPLCTICNPIGDSKSIKENNLFEFITKVYKGEIIASYRDGLEIDIYLPELNIGFEFNGLYYHSEKFKNKNYHIDKTNYFKVKGIRIIHIWEDDWDFNRDIIESQICNLISSNNSIIFARKCQIKEVSVKEAKLFLNENHIQGFVSSSIKLGLYFNDKIVSIMTFDKNEGRKKMNNDEWNLSRFCNLLNTSVIGGASKLLKYFLRNYNVARIISYADKDWSIGKLYEILGFNNIFESKPDYKYVINNRREHKSKFRKSKLNTDLSESKEMLKRDNNRIYDCGKIKFEKIL